MSSIPLFFISFSPPEPSNNILCSSHQRKERETNRERGERLGDQRSPCRQRSRFTMPSKIEVHHALSRPPSHRRSSSSPPPGWVGLFFFFSFFSFFSYLLVLIQLYFIRIGIFFVFCVWIM